MWLGTELKSSVVNTELKYSLNKLADYFKSVIMLPASFISGPDLTFDLHLLLPYAKNDFLSDLIFFS